MISPDYHFKSNHGQVKISILIPRYAIYLHGVLHTVKIIYVVCAYRGDRFPGVLHTAEIISAVCFTPLR